MKKTVSLLSNLLVASTILWGVAMVEANDEIVKTEVITGYCHMKFPPMHEATLSWDRPELNTDVGNIIDFYGPCDYDPTGAAEVRAQRRLLQDGSDD